MLVRDFMSTNVLTAAPETYVSEAYELMKKHQVRQLPVVDSQCRLLGIVSDRDIRQVLLPAPTDSQVDTQQEGARGELPSRTTKMELLPSPDQVMVSEIMTKEVLTIEPDADLAEAASLIYFQKIGGLPVADAQGKVIGMLTTTDLLRIFIEMVNMIGTSSRIDIVLGEDPRGFSKASSIIENYGGEIVSVWMSGVEDERDERLYYFRLEACETDLIAEDLRKAGFSVVTNN